MRSRWGWLVGVALLAGCQGAAPAPNSPLTAGPAATVAAPTHFGAGDIALVREGKTVTVGMRANDAFDAFRDPRDGGFEDERLPAGFAPPYRARSWETSQRGFGVITYQDGVVAAMYQEHDCTLEKLAEWVDVHTRRMNRAPDRQIIGQRLNYYFWETNGQRLMILGFQKAASGSVQLTAAMGDVAVMDAIGASVKKAEEEKEPVDRLLRGNASPEIPGPIRKG